MQNSYPYIQYLLKNYINIDFLHYILNNINSNTIIKEIKDHLIYNIDNFLNKNSQDYKNMFWEFWHKEIIKNIAFKISNDWLIICTYNKKIQSFQMWTQLTLDLRWVILDLKDNFKIISLPFKKFFNVDEFNVINTDVNYVNSLMKKYSYSITEKLDWALWQLFYHNWKYRISTKWWFDNIESNYATNYFNKNILPNIRNNLKSDFLSLVENYTLLFEIITPDEILKTEENNNFEHIIKYNYEWIVLIGIREKHNYYELLTNYHLYEVWNKYNIPVVEDLNDKDYNNIEDLINDIKHIKNYEWVVINFQIPFENVIESFKIKTDFHIMENKKLNWLTKEKIIKAINSNKINELYEKNPEELHQYISDVIIELKKDFLNYIIYIENLYFEKIYWNNLEKLAYIEYIKTNYSENKIYYWLLEYIYNKKTLPTEFNNDFDKLFKTLYIKNI